MFLHFVSYLGTAISKMPSLVGSNWGGLLFPAILFIITEVILSLWGDMKTRWGRNALIGFAIAGIAWTMLFALSAFLTVYDDHKNLVGATARIKRTMKSDVDGSRRQLTEAKLACARQQGQNDTLQEQNRDQQNSINGCLTQAMKFLTPEPQRSTPVAFEVDDTQGDLKVSRWLIFTNSVVSTTDLIVTCDVRIQNISAKIVGATGRNGGIARLNDKSFEIRIDTPAWTQTAPVWVETVTPGHDPRSCSFARR